MSAKTVTSQTISEDQQRAIKKFQAAYASAEATIIQVESGDYFALSKAYYMEELKPAFDALHLPDSYTLEMEGGNSKFTIAQLKRMVPRWHLISQNAKIWSDILRELSSNYGALVLRLELVKQGNESTRTTSMGLVDKLEENIKAATNAKLPDDFPITVNGEIVYFSVVKDQFQGIKKIFAQGEADRKAKQAAWEKSFRDVLKDGKLKVFNEEVAQASKSFYNENAKVIQTPAEFATAKVWAQTYYVYSSDDNLKLNPIWRMNIHYFDDMKLLKSTELKGTGTFPPSSAFEWKKQ